MHCLFYVHDYVNTLSKARANDSWRGGATYTGSFPHPAFESLGLVGGAALFNYSYCTPLVAIMCLAPPHPRNIANPIKS